MRLEPVQGGVEAAIADVATRCLGSRTTFDPDTPFALLGLDSLTTIEMAAALEDRLGCRLPPELLADCDTGRALATRIAAMQTTPHAGRCDPYQLMLADAVLPVDVQPPAAVPCSTDLRSARKILLTGATGFLGGALLQELLDNTGAEIVCLVRRPRAAAPGQDPISSSSRKRRVRWIAGDLASAGLGLAPGDWDALASQIDVVLHCGAAVNWVFPYEGLRAANVLGTRELLRLACRRGIPFHFVSSLSVCYSTTGPRTADEEFEPLQHLRGLHLGYAQTKAVAEALVAEAGRRGLPTRIYRPALISGDSTSGAYNRDDLISLLVRGCVRMGTAPDLDWNLDCEPVDQVATGILRLSGAAGPVFNLGHPSPRHWRECVLWIRTYGYSVRLVPYHAWLRQLDRETAVGSADGATHPLRPLRTFFFQRHHGARGLTLPELYEERRRTRADGTVTRVALAERGSTSSPLDARLLDIYFRALRRCGDLPDPPVPVRCAPASTPAAITPDFVGRLLGRQVKATRVLATGSDHSIVSELTTWRSGTLTGLFHLSVDLEDGSSLDLRLKARAADTDTIEVGHCLADVLDPLVGAAYARWRDRIGFTAAHRREVEIYRQQDPRFVRHAPALLGSFDRDPDAGCVLALENIEDARLMNSAGDVSEWTPADIRAAIDGLAALHAIWYGREEELQTRPWIGHVHTAASMVEMTDLWGALARHAAPAFSSWTDSGMSGVQQRLIAGIDCWWQAEAAPRTLIHHDFNPRNICLRQGRLCAYDWELAAVGAPQRDLAEFLCFVLPADAHPEQVRHWIEYHRVALEQEAGVAIDPHLWQQGFRCGLYDFIINRLAFYALIHRIRRQPFLPRVVRTWRRLYDLYPFDPGK